MRSLKEENWRTCVFFINSAEIWEQTSAKRQTAVKMCITHFKCVWLLNSKKNTYVGPCQIWKLFKPCLQGNISNAYFEVWFLGLLISAPLLSLLSSGKGKVEKFKYQSNKLHSRLPRKRVWDLARLKISQS